MKTEFVSDWMTTHLVVASPETTMSEAERLMRQRMVRRLPVIKNDKLVGILTFGDIRRASPSEATSLTVWEMKDLLNKLKVEEVMTRNPITVAPTMTIGATAQLMLQHKLSGLPVLDEKGKLIGIITESDIFRMVVKDWVKQQQEENEPFSHYA